jgi:hypothetical protein
VAIIIATSQKMAQRQGEQTSMGHNDYVVYQGDFEQMKTILQSLSIEPPALAATHSNSGKH